MLLIDSMSYQYLVGAEIDYPKASKARSSSFEIRTRPLLAVVDRRSRPESDAFA